jgi:hypothetical protein
MAVVFNPAATGQTPARKEGISSALAARGLDVL